MRPSRRLRVSTIVSLHGTINARRVFNLAATVVLHTASGFHTGIAKSLLEGLAERKARTGNEVYYMHTSGTSNVSDSPILGLYPQYPHGIFHDSDPLHTLNSLKYMNEIFAYPQRNTDLLVVRTGMDTGIKTYIFICPILFGEGIGDFHKLTHQVPDMMRRGKLPLSNLMGLQMESPDLFCI